MIRNAKIGKFCRTRNLKTVIGSMIMMTVFAAWGSTTAYGQYGMSSQVLYSDGWYVSNATEEYDYESGETMWGEGSPAGYMVGVGISSDSYNSYNHRYWVNTSLTSADGRVAQATSYTSASYARAEVTLTVSISDSGQFTVNTAHWFTCPYMFGPVNNANTSFPITYEPVSDHYRLSAVGWFSCRYEPTCIGRCSKFPYRRKIVFPGAGCEPFLQCTSILVHIRNSSYCTIGGCVGAGPVGFCS